VKGTSLYLVRQQDWTSKQGPSLAEYNLHIDNEHLHGTGQRLFQKGHTAIVGWFAGHTCKNYNKWYTEVPKLWYNFYSIYTQFTHMGRGLETMD